MNDIAKRVVIYARYSTENQSDKSTRDQINSCTDFANIRGWIIEDTLSDEAISGTDDNRPNYLKLKDLISNRSIDIICAVDLDRLSRDMAESANLYKLCKFNDIEIITIKEGLVGPIHIGMTATASALFLEAIGINTHRGLIGKVKDGKSAGGKSYGYSIAIDERGLEKKGEFIINQEQATVIRRIFTEYAAGHSARTIAYKLNEDRVPSPSGKEWKQNTINGNRERGTGILNNELYVGTRIWNRLKYMKNPVTGKRNSRLRPQSEWMIVPKPDLRIIDDDLWLIVKQRQEDSSRRIEVNAKGDKNKLSGVQSTRTNRYLLSGLVYCGKCGSKMSISGSQPKRFYCSSAKEKGPTVCKGFKGVIKDKIENTILSALKEKLMTEDAVEHFVSKYEAQQEQLTQDRTHASKHLTKAIAQVDKERGNLMNAVKQGIISETLQEELSDLESKKNELLSQLDAQKSTLPTIPENLSEVYLSQITNLLEALNDPSTQTESITSIRHLIDSIVVTYDEGTKQHEFELIGELVNLMGLAETKKAVAYASASSSIKLVAGARFELTHQ